MPTEEQLIAAYYEYGQVPRFPLGDVWYYGYHNGTDYVFVKIDRDIDGIESGVYGPNYDNFTLHSDLTDLPDDYLDWFEEDELW